MKEYVLNEECSIYGGFQESDFEWVVYFYEDIDGYSGGGEAVALGKDGQLHLHNLGHCSCYGPFDEFPNGGSLSVDEFISQGEFATDTIDAEVRKKAEELLKG